MIGSTVAGRYHIEAQIGIGGMGVVYRARDERLRRDVALKVIAPHLMQQAAARARFLREAQALAGLTHPNIVTVYDLAEDADASLVLLIMELLSGQSLRQAMESETCPRSRECPPFSHVALPLCRALEAAHAQGILHRDIKPENIFVCRDGTLKLMDFGLARLLGDHSKNHSSTVVGTLAYMAPEQLRGEPLDARADLYALGVVFYEFLVEWLPFVADNPGAVLMKHLSEPAPHLRDTRPDLPAALDAVIARMLEKDPAARFASARDVRAALEQTGVEDGTLALTTDRLQNAWAGRPATSEHDGMPTRDIATDFASIPSASSAAPAVQAPTLVVEQPTVPVKAATPAGANSARRSRRSDVGSSTRLYTGLVGAAIVAALFAGQALLHPSVPAAPPSTATRTASVLVKPSPPRTLSSAPFLSSAVPTTSGSKDADGKSGNGTTGENRKENGSTPASTSLIGKASSPIKAAPATPEGTVTASVLPPNQTGIAKNANALAPLSHSERAELDTLRREQQEELSLLRDLKQQIGSASTRSGRASNLPLNPVASVPLGKAAKPANLPAASQTTPDHAPSVAAAPAPSTRGVTTHTALPAEWSQLTPAVTPAKPPAAAPTPATQAQSQARGETSQFEEARPNTPLRLRVLRHALPQDSRAIHVSFRNSADCYAYFYIVDIDKRRALRAFPGPERFLAPQSDAPQDIRLPLPPEIDNNRKAVLTLASAQEITNLPPAFTLPPAPLDMPAAGATLLQTRQALHHYNDQIGMLLQQSHALVNGKLLHPHDVIVRVTGLRPPPPTAPH